MPARPAPSLVIVLVLAGLLTVLGGSKSVPQVVLWPLGAAIVLWLPGYALVVSVMGGLYPTRLLGALMSVAGSLMIVIFTGVGLHLTPEGMTPSSWSLALGGITAVLALTAMLRARSLPASGGSGRPAFRLRIAFLPAATYVLAALVMVAAMGLAISAAEHQRSSVSFASLWMLPGEAGTVRIGVANRGEQDREYWLRLTTSGEAVGSWDIALEANQTWESTFADPRPLVGPRDDLVATLTAIGSPAASARRVVLRGTSSLPTRDSVPSGHP